MKKEFDPDEAMDEFLHHPLNNPDIDESDPLIQGLQALALESDPNIAGQSYYDYAFSFLKIKGKSSIRESIQAFSEGINKKPTDPEIAHKLFRERARCHMMLENYGYAIKDIDKAYELKQATEMLDMKIKSLFEINRLAELIKLVKDNSEVEFSADSKEMFSKALEKFKQEEELKKKIEMSKKKKKSEKSQILSAIKKKNLKIGSRVHNIPEMIDTKITIDESGKLHFPALLIYEESMQIDVIKDFLFLSG